jgi:predicted DNA-binding transcriptional regulator AlpA
VRETSAAPTLDGRRAAPAVEPLAWDIKRLAEALSISTASAWRLNAAGKLPRPVRVGRSVRWPVAEVRAWLAAGCPPRDVWEAMRPSASLRLAERGT